MNVTEFESGNEHMKLIEDLERLKFKLLVESELQSTNAALSKKLADMALETADAVDRARSISSPVASRAMS